MTSAGTTFFCHGFLAVDELAEEVRGAERLRAGVAVCGAAAEAAGGALAPPSNVPIPAPSIGPA